METSNWSVPTTGWAQLHQLLLFGVPHQGRPSHLAGAKDPHTYALQNGIATVVSIGFLPEKHYNLAAPMAMHPSLSRFPVFSRLIFHSILHYSRTIVMSLYSQYIVVSISSSASFCIRSSNIEQFWSLQPTRLDFRGPIQLNT